LTQLARPGREREKMQLQPGPGQLVTRSAAGPHGPRITSPNVHLRQLTHPQPGAAGNRRSGHDSRAMARGKMPPAAGPRSPVRSGGSIGPGPRASCYGYAANVRKHLNAQPAWLWSLSLPGRDSLFFLARFMR